MDRLSTITIIFSRSFKRLSFYSGKRRATDVDLPSAYLSLLFIGNSSFCDSGEVSFTFAHVDKFMIFFSFICMLAIDVKNIVLNVDLFMHMFSSFSFNPNEGVR